MMKYIYVRTDDNQWTVGTYLPDNKWVPESDHGVEPEAADRAHELNRDGRSHVCPDDKDWKFNQPLELEAWLHDTIGCTLTPLSREVRNDLLRTGIDTIKGGGLRGDICDAWRKKYGDRLFEMLDRNKLYV